MPTDPNMTGLIYPTEDGDADTWDTIMNTTCWPVLGAHSHTPGDGVPIRSAALQINADVSWASGGSSFSILDLKAIDFTPVAPSTVVSLASAFFVSNADNNLYFRNSSGSNVQLTSGSTINFSLAGGIGGDYAAVSALLDFDDASDTYRARQEQSASVRQYAKFGIADLILREYKAAGVTPVPSNAVTIKSPAALAASYSITLPAAVPASSAFTMMDSSGVLTVSVAPTVTGDITAATFHNTTGEDFSVPGAFWQDPNGSHTKALSAAGAQYGWTIAASSSKFTMPLNVKTGDVITGWKAYVKKNTNNTNTITCRLYSIDGVVGTETALGTLQSSSANAPTFMSLSETGLSITVDAIKQYYLVFTPGAGVTPSADLLLHATVTRTHP